MANFEAGDKIVPALRSVLDQTMPDLEVIVSDDGSRDHSVELVRAMMEQDGRIRLIADQANGGPARCRNRALEVARGRWVAIVDSDDIIHPERLERLLSAAVSLRADIVADDQLLFHEDGSRPSLMLGETAGSLNVTATQWVLAGMDGTPALGYLKPLIRAEVINGLRYDEALRIGEDYDFILRLLMDGARMLVVPEPFYLYRRHSSSISHRLSPQDVQAMIDQQVLLTEGCGPLSPELDAAFARRLATLMQGQAYERLVAALKSGDVGQVFAGLICNPAQLGRLWTSFVEGRLRRNGAPLQRLEHEELVLSIANSPAYVPADMVDWSAARPRNVWLELARHAGRRCMVADRAGQYAAGFIPEVVVEFPETGNVP